ncbi:unnamed protein product [Hyaloperonospora brassicae]|uniref:PHD-type domain-containing protein n=1 Tax=Hyaloperonospora brassicae TaxID=162125 RepID=A0AAV0SZU5_HYABA|nr:unnamed protein product [Hyaloperonospora brassicae]
MADDHAARRAVIPPILPQEQRDALVYTPQCHQRWGGRQIEDRIKTEVVDQFLEEFASLHETEAALQCLFESNFDQSKAVQLLHAARRQRQLARRDRDEKIDAETFRAAIKMHGKKFHLVQQALDDDRVHTRDIVSNYYSWKRTPEFRKWRRRQRPMRKCRQNKKETKRLRLNGESDEDLEAETLRDYHDKKCGRCTTGGKLLCCDGCTRAYHFSCIEPPILTMPRDDDEWFCPYCQAVFGGTKPKMVPSDENEYCLVCLPFPHVPHTLVDVSTDGSSDEQEVDEAEGHSGHSSDADASSRSNNEETSDLSARTSNLLRTEELTAESADPRSATTTKSNASAENLPSSLHGADAIKSSDLGHMPTSAEETRGPEQPRAPAGQLRDALPRDAPIKVVGLFVEVPAEGARAQAEKPVPGRKRHRKTLAPRRIPPSRLDN